MRRLAIIILGLVVLGLAAYFLFRPEPTGVTDPATAESATNQTPAPKPNNPSRPRNTGPPEGPNFYSFPEPHDKPQYRHAPDPDDHRVTRLKDGTVQVNPAMDHARVLHSKETTPDQDIENINAILGLYFWVYRQNPVGDNVDIVNQLTGNNEKKLVVLPPDHPDINANGELVDRFGNPYFFHALADDKMDIWSYGPDGIVGTIDDVFLYGPDAYTDNDNDDPGND